MRKHHARSRRQPSVQGAAAELIHCRAPWNTREAVELATLELVSWLNHRCQFERLGYIPLAEAEANYSKQLSSQAIPA
jgi:putative transposase